MDLRSGRPFTLVRHGLVETYPPLASAEKCDVAVIGAGISGALVADELTRVGLDVVVLDRRDVAHGSTAASTSQLQYEVDTPLRELIGLVGEAHARRAYQIGVEAVERVQELASEFSDPSHFRRVPSLYFASTKRDAAWLPEEAELRRKAGIAVELWDAGAVAERFPFRASSALFSEQAGQVDAYLLTHRLLHRCVTRGARVYDRTNLRDVVRKGRGMTLVTDRGFEVQARHLVFCTGYESVEWIPNEETGRLRSTYAAVGEPVDDFPGWHRRCLVWETARPYHYFRTTDDNRPLIGGLDQRFESAVKRDARIATKTRRLEHKFRSLFPAIEYETAYAWAGTFGETKDGLAYLGEPTSFPGAFFVLGYGGNGITWSITAAGLARDWVLRKKNKDAEIFRFGR